MKNIEERCRQAEQTRDAAQAEATKQTLLVRELLKERDELRNWNQQAHRVLTDADVPSTGDMPPASDTMFLWRRLEWLVARLRATQELATAVRELLDLPLGFPSYDMREEARLRVVAALKKIK